MALLEIMVRKNSSYENVSVVFCQLTEPSMSENRLEKAPIFRKAALSSDRQVFLHNIQE